MRPRILAALVLLGLPAAGAAAAPVEVVVASDPHLIAPELHDGGSAWTTFSATGAGRDIVHSDDLADAFERDLAALRPRWLLLTGDLTNNGERASHEAVARRLARIEALGIRVAVLPGNHDLANPWARAFRGDRQVPVASVSDADFARIYRDFGFADARSRDPASLSYVVDLGQGVWVAMLDTVRWRDNRPEGGPTTNGRLAEATQNWLREQSAAARKAGAALFAAQHHSFFDHSPVIARGYTVDNADAERQLFSDLGIRLVLTGHIHIQDAVTRPLAGRPVTDIATNALSVYPHQFGRLTLDGAAGTAAYRSRKVDVEGWARATGKTDPVLRNFDAWASDDFGAQALRLVRRGLADLDDDAQSQAAVVMAELNRRYFAGTEGLNAAGLADSAGYQLLINADGFLAEYAESLLADDGTDDNAVDVRL